MAFAYVPIQIFDEDKFEQCIVIPFPEGGKIVDTLVVNKAAFLLVEVHPNARLEQAHFHVVPALVPLFADGHEYVGTFQIEDFRGVPLALYTVIRITSGDFGVHSFEYKAIYGETKPKEDQLTNEPTPEVIKNPDLTTEFNDAELRKLWDFDTSGDNGGGDKTNDDENVEPESES